jgi:hypothetical protein
MDDDTQDPPDPGPAAPEAVDAFIARWHGASGSERANYQLFLTELCALLGLPQPDPAREDTRDNTYCFERRVIFQHGDGTQSQGFIDLYRRACYVLEAKQSGLELDSGGWDKAMLRAQGQAVQYTRALPPEEGRPPFVVVVDVGRSIELYSEFSRSGGAYIPYPDPRAHRIRLADLRRPEIRARLRAVWLDPLALDPSRHAARVTREIAARLARLAQSLESSGHPPELAAGFLIRCLFTLFAEDVGLLPKAAFTDLLASVRDNPAQFVPLTEHLWRDMNTGTPFSVVLRERVLRFNGGLFAQATALPLDREQIGLLIEAGRADWRHVEPAIFGTLLERALDPLERHKLGAHYTPRAYVERLVLPTVIEPLREEWTNLHTAAFALHEQGKDFDAIKLVSAFQVRLANLRVLDPACGSGNFLYVTLEHLKRLEGEVLDTLESLGERQILLELEGVSVDPHQLLGLELNPRAASIAEMVLWIGYLQWHFRTHGNIKPPEPVIRDFRNIQCRDAVLAYDRVELVTDPKGLPVTRWDGRTYKPHPVTGEPVPDETAQVPLERYVNPRRAEWPEADFVVGNPPFIGNKRMRLALGDGYVEALRRAWADVPGSADYVMYWWHHAAELTRTGRLRRFGLITTNSLKQSFNRQVIEGHLAATEPLSLVYAVPDHPWVDSADGAAVRIAMSAAEAGSASGALVKVISERADNDGEAVAVELVRSEGRINADLSVGVDLSAATPLRANLGLAYTGMYPLGQGFVVQPEDLARAVGTDTGTEQVLKPFVIARDLTQVDRRAQIIDFYPRGMEEARAEFPCLFQWVLERVKPERDHNPRQVRRENWWRFAEPNPSLRRATLGLRGMIAVPRTAKWFTFQLVSTDTIPDTAVVAIASADSFLLGVLSSRLHLLWATTAGGRLGVGNDPRYQHKQTFNPFPFPDPDGTLREGIGVLAEELDAHRKRRQALHPGLTITGMYNVLERLRLGEPLGAKERQIHEQGLVSVLGQLHDALDAAVLAAYGWDDLAPHLIGRPGGTTPLPDKPTEQAEAEEELLTRLVALNRERAAEEARGRVRWLRPDFQNPRGGGVEQAATEVSAVPTEAPGRKADWPKPLPDQVQALRSALASQPGPASAEDLARTFNRAPRAKVAELLETLAALGQVRRLPDGRFAPG